MKTGVIIGRFQVPELTPAHRALIKRVSEENDKVLFLIGQSDVKGTQRYPLDFDSVNAMLREDFPTTGIAPVYDHESDEYWSQRVDNEIHSLCSLGELDCMPEDITLYGGRDSFIPFYSGIYPTKEILHLGVESKSGTEIREGITYPVTKEGRAGAIYSAMNRWPTMYQVVDAVILNEKGEVLLCRKEGSTEWGAIGGFVDPEDENLEGAIKREVKEETGLEINPEYQFSIRIDDRRYTKEVDKVMSHVFLCTIAGNCEAKPADDIVEAKFFKRHEMPELIPNHREMFRKIGLGMERK